MAHTTTLEDPNTAFQNNNNVPFGNQNMVCSGKVKMDAGSFYIPKDNPLKPLGEDGHFLSPDLQTFGVADGVGGWAEEGVDSGKYSRELMENTLLFIQEQKDHGPIDPKKALKQAFLKTEAEGSSTACIITLHEDCSLVAVNVGDSGFVHLRGKKIIYRSPVQQHFFNCPYQLEKGTNAIDFAEEIKRDVVPGDIIVAGTDGLFDNVHEGELEELVSKWEEANGPEVLAREIADFALDQARNEFAVTPYAIEKEKEIGVECIGGKYDDITVVVGHILAAE